jgi:hypothetical protein
VQQPEGDAAHGQQAEQHQAPREIRATISHVECLS